jgi:hypothetical protein
MLARKQQMMTKMINLCQCEVRKDNEDHFQDNEIPGKGQPQVEEIC